jgi:carbamoyl-phosphate synthase large subunit
VFPFNRFPGVDPVLSPEMKSTGEVMGIDSDFAPPSPSRSSGGDVLPKSGTPVRQRQGQRQAGDPAGRALLAELGFTIVATGGTADYLEGAGRCGRARQQGGAGPAAHRRPDQGRRRRT